MHKISFKFIECSQITLRIGCVCSLHRCLLLRLLHTPSVLSLDFVLVVIHILRSHTFLFSLGCPFFVEQVGVRCKCSIRCFGFHIYIFFLSLLFSAVRLYVVVRSDRGCGSGSVHNRYRNICQAKTICDNLTCNVRLKQTNCLTT